MLTMETAGSWFDMGKQLGETFSHELKRCVDRFVGLIETHRTDTDATASAVRQQVEKYSPHLLEETAGMAEGSGIPELRLFKHRFYGNVMSLAPTGCSAFFVLDDESQSWLARSCDIEEEDHWCQICQVHRPADRYATATTSYLGFAGNVGINEHGLGIVGVSASTRETYGDAGIPSALLLDRALGSCRTLEEANEMLLA